MWGLSAVGSVEARGVQGVALLPAATGLHDLLLLLLLAVVAAGGGDAVEAGGVQELEGHGCYYQVSAIEDKRHKDKFLLGVGTERD